VRTLLGALFALAASVSLAAPGFAATSSWPMVQGGAAHLGVAADAPPPPYREAWRAEAGTSGDRGASGPVIVGDLAIALGREEVVAVKASSGKVEWSVVRAIGTTVTPAVSEDGSTLVYPEGSGDAAALIGLDLETRSVRWRFVTRGDVGAAPAIDGQTVYVGTDAGFVQAVDVQTGRERWSFDGHGPVRTAVAAAGGRVFAIAENQDTFQATVYAIGADAGKEDWRFAPTGAASFASAVSVAEDRVFVALGDRKARALDVETGRLLWEAIVQAPFGPASTPAIVDGDVLFADISGTLERFDGATGERRWRFRFPAAIVDSAPLVVDGYVVVGLVDGALVAVDAVSGRQVWDLDLGSSTVGGLAPAGDVLIAGMPDKDGGLAAVEHDPNAGLRSVESPTILHPGTALANFGIAFAAVLGGFVIASRILVRTGRGSRTGGRRSRPEEGRRTDRPEPDPQTSRDDDEDGPPGGYR
jgi:outer membrane protein assembly factor BamB